MKTAFLYGVLTLAVCEVSACQSIGSLTPAQTGALICALGADGATVIATYAPKSAPKASATATIACQAGTQVGSILR